MSGRLRVLCLAAALLTALAPAASGQADEPPRVVALDWGLTTTLLGLGVELPALAERSSYRDWVEKPAPPAATPDLGLRLFPDMERLQAIDPDLILVTPQFASIEARLETVAPTRSLATFTPEKKPLANARRITRELGRLLQRERQAEELIARTETAIDGLRRAAAPRRCALLVVNFVDAGHVRVFGEGSLYDGVLSEAGIENAWSGRTNFWGFGTLPVSELLHYPQAALVVVGPVPAKIRRIFEGEEAAGLIGRLPAVRSGHYRLLRPIWSFGGLTEAATFAATLSKPENVPDCSDVPS